jgi:hypothetical protein
MAWLTTWQPFRYFPASCQIDATSWETVMLIELTLNDDAATPVFINPAHVVAVYRTPAASATIVCCVSSGGDRRNIFAVRETAQEVAEEFE